jgi:fructose-1,6-bisphosphatase I
VEHLIDKMSKQISEDQALINVVASLYAAARRLFTLLRESDDGHYAELETSNATGDRQTRQDTVSNAIFEREIVDAGGVRDLITEERADPYRVGEGRYSIALDPFDGSKAFRYGIPPGSIFAIFRDARGVDGYIGENICASGVFTYGVGLSLLLSIGGRVFSFRDDAVEIVDGLGTADRFVAVNLSNISRWPAGWRDYFASAVLSGEAPHYNTRWFGSLATHTRTVVLGGGLFAYPPDTRAAYHQGHLRLLYEAMPVAFIMDALGGLSTDGYRSILTITPKTIHDKVPLAFGEYALVTALREAIERNQSPRQL